MALISDILLASGAFAAAIYCYVLARRLTRFTRLESGMGGAIAVLSVQVDDMTRALEEARIAAKESTDSLAGLTSRAEKVAGQIELLLASMHDLPEASAKPAASEAPGTGDRKMHFSRHRSRRTEADPLILSEAAE